MQLTASATGATLPETSGGSTPAIVSWQMQSRLDGFTRSFASLTGTETAVIEQLQRYRANGAAAASNVGQLLDTAD